MILEKPRCPRGGWQLFRWISRAYWAGDLMAKMADAGEAHRDAGGVRRGDALFVAHRPSGMDHRGDSRLDRRFEPVGKGEEGVRGEHRPDGRRLRQPR